MLGRVVLGSAALLLIATAIVHAMGLPMVSGWGEGLARQQQLALCLLWAAASVAWVAVALIWGVAAWRRGPRWPAAIATLVPLHAAAGVLYIDATFFGGQMLAGSVVLAVAGLFLLKRA